MIEDERARELVVEALTETVIGSIRDGSLALEPAQNSGDYRCAIARVVHEQLAANRTSHILIFIAVSDSASAIEALPMDKLI